MMKTNPPPVNFDFFAEKHLKMRMLGKIGINMILFSGLFSAFVFLFSCNGKKEYYREIEKSYSSGTPHIVNFYESKDKKQLTKQTVYYKNGHKKMEGNFKNGKRDGLWQAWFADGKLWSETNYTEGIENGQKTVYYENGQKYFSGEMKNGKRRGKWTFWKENGEILKEIDYH